MGSASASRSASTTSGMPPTSTQPRGPATLLTAGLVTPQLAAGAKPLFASVRSAALTSSPPAGQCVVLSCDCGHENTETKSREQALRRAAGRELTAAS